jgi:L-Ala-D/L-Glu epimerase
MLTLETRIIDWTLHEPFVISRVTHFSVPCIHVYLTDEQGHVGRGEAVGVDYAGETTTTMIDQIKSIRANIEAGLTLDMLQTLLPHGGARNAVDCALWDLKSKQDGIPVWKIAGLSAFAPMPTAFTFGIMDEAALRDKARQFAHFPILKVKTNSDLGLDPVKIVHEAAPRSRLIVDPNQAWDIAELRRFQASFEPLNVALLEQPVAVDNDNILKEVALSVPVVADEAFQDRGDIEGFIGKYQVLNIKLDKTGGLTEALACARIGLRQGYRIMVGCMVGSSLSMAPGTIIAQLSDYVDLDGPLLQAEDVDPPIVYEAGMIMPPAPELWG